MARGWESKAVADQIEEGNSARPQSSAVVANAADRQQQQHLQSLVLSRSRLLQQLERAQHPAHRRVLLNGLQAIELEMESLSKSTDVVG